MRRVTFILIGILSVAVAAWGGDPWKQKAYKDWDDNDLKRILFDSPWAKKVSITLSSGMPSVQGGPPAQAPAAGSGSYGMAGGGATGGGAPQSVNTGAGKLMNQISFVVRWFSAMTERRAIARDAVHRHGLTEEQAEQGLAAHVDDYVVFLMGSDMSAFEGLDQPALQKITFLRPEQTKNRFTPSKVDIQKRPYAKPIDLIIFHFAKKFPNGEPAISLNEKSIEFSCELRSYAIHTTFEPQRMANQDGPDW